MPENATIARPYAKAAFEQARQEGDLKQWSEMLRLVSLVVSDPLMKSVLDNPRIPDERLLELVLEVCGDRLTKTGRNFVTVLARADRLAVAPDISEFFDKRRAEEEGTVEVEVVSAYELDKDQSARIAEVMHRRLGKKIEISTSTDKSLIGGAVIRAGDSVIDASLRGRLTQLKNDFAE